MRARHPPTRSEVDDIWDRDTLDRLKETGRRVALGHSISVLTFHQRLVAMADLLLAGQSVQHDGGV